jgi:hypothetical protein
VQHLVAIQREADEIATLLLSCSVEPRQLESVKLGFQLIDDRILLTPKLYMQIAKHPCAKQ